MEQEGNGRKRCDIEEPSIHLSSLNLGIFISVNSVSSILAIIGNSFVLLVVYKTNSLRNTSNFFLCSLAMADLLVGLVVIPINTSLVSLGLLLDFDNVLFKFNNGFSAMLLVATTLNLCVVSIDRLVAVKWPLRYPTIMTPKVTSRVITTVWLVSIVLSIPIVSSDDIVETYWISISVVTFFAPLLIIIYCYSVILKITNEQQQRVVPQLGNFPEVSGMATSSNEDRITRMAKNRKAATTFVIIIAVFCFSVLPNSICSILYSISFRECPVAVLYILNNWDWYVFLSFSSSFLSPVIYGLRMKQFRTAFKGIFTCN